MNNLIEKYFDSHPDKSVDTKFRDEAAFFNRGNYIQAIERVDGDSIKVCFKEKQELRDEAIIENGVKVGVGRLVTPHTVIIREGSFICSGVKKVLEKNAIDKRSVVDLFISKKFWSKKLSVKINNKFLNVRFNRQSS